MGSIKDRNGMDLEAEDIKKRWQEYTEELYKKILHLMKNWDTLKGIKQRIHVIHFTLQEKKGSRQRSVAISGDYYSDADRGDEGQR